VALYKRTVGLLAGLRLPVQPGYAPICTTCGKYLDSEQLVEDSGTIVKVLGKHHGAEELAAFDLGTRHHASWDDRVEDLAKMIRGHRWFDPTTVPK
jgi:hypothetical protein